MAPTIIRARAEALLGETFETTVAAFLVATGTAANALALSALANPWEAVFCHEEAHIHDDECGAPEFFTGGAKLVGIPGDGGKITPDALRETLARFPRGLVKSPQPGALSLSQATEAGTIYRSTRSRRSGRDRAQATGVAVHMDGARFANALVSLGVAPADMTWRAGVDALSFGATKNGALACEAVIFFDPSAAETLPSSASAAAIRCRRAASSARRWRPTSRAAFGSTWRARANAAARRLRAGARGSARRAAGLADGGQRGVRRRADGDGCAMARRRGRVPRLGDAIARAGKRAARGRDADSTGDVVRD